MSSFSGLTIWHARNKMCVNEGICLVMYHQYRVMETKMLRPLTVDAHRKPSFFLVIVEIRRFASSVAPVKLTIYPCRLFRQHKTITVDELRWLGVPSPQPVHYTICTWYMIPYVSDLDYSRIDRAPVSFAPRAINSQPSLCAHFARTDRAIFGWGSNRCRRYHHSRATVEMRSFRSQPEER